jgi:hypothetical protein
LRIAGADTRCGVRQRGDFARAGARRDFGIARELRELSGGQLLAEEQRRGVRKLVRLVENDRVARGQQLGETFVAQHHVGEEQVVVDDDDVRFERRLARLQHEAVGVKRAMGTEAVVARRRDERPDRRVLGDVGERAAIAGRRRVRECDDAGQVARILARRKPSFRSGSRKVVVADVVGAALEQRNRQRKTQRVADERQVALEELILQRLRPRGNDHLAAVEEGGHQVGECLAGAGTRPRRSARRAREWRPRPPGPSRVVAVGSGIPAARAQASRRRRISRSVPDPASLHRSGRRLPQRSSVRALRLGRSLGGRLRRSLGRSLGGGSLRNFERRTDQHRALAEDSVRLAGAGLVLRIALARDPFETAERRDQYSCSECSASTTALFLPAWRTAPW